MKCMIDDNNGNGYAEKPTGAAIGRIRNQMETVWFSDPMAFVNAIAQGCAWIPAVMEGGQRRENWQSQQLIALDFDNKDDAGASLSLEQCINATDVADRLLNHGINPLCAYATYSCTQEHPRFRVVIMLDEANEDPDVMEDAIDRLLYLFPEADQACKDLARLFFGARDFMSVAVMVGEDWEPCDIRTILALPARPDEPIKQDKHTARRKGAKAYRGKGRKQVDLAALKADADLLGMIQYDTGEQGRRHGRYVEFHRCPVCGHKDCFRYYPDNNSWTCFSDSNTTGKRGGTVIDYMIARDGLSVDEAIAVLAGEAED